MNYFILTAGIISTTATIGHFALGAKDFLKPVMTSTVDEIPKKVMQSLFHYMSVFMILTSVVLLAFSTGEKLIFDSINDVVKLIGITYAGFAIAQFIIAATSTVKMGVLKMFQWIFWTLIAIFTLLGVYC